MTNDESTREALVSDQGCVCETNTQQMHVSPSLECKSSDAGHSQVVIVLIVAVTVVVSPARTWPGAVALQVCRCDDAEVAAAKAAGRRYLDSDVVPL